jgi:hypothetical protein
VESKMRKIQILKFPARDRRTGMVMNIRFALFTETEGKNQD